MSTPPNLQAVPPGEPPWDVSALDVGVEYWRTRLADELEAGAVEPPEWLTNRLDPADEVTT